MRKMLAIEGGAPIRTSPWPSRALYDDNEIKATVSLLNRSRKDVRQLWRREGTNARAFESTFATFIGTSFATASSSGTAAVHAALAACEFEPGSEVIVPPITDVGSVTPILYEELVPVFADVDPLTLNVDPLSVERRISNKTKAIIVVHLAGYPCNMEPIMAVARKNDLVVIEDCAQALGAKYDNRMVGTMGDFGTFSFMGIKHIVAGGEGGMTITSREDLWTKMMIFTRNILTPSSQFLYDIPSRALNYRITEIQATLGIEQLKKVEWIMKRRKELYDSLSIRIAHLSSIKMAKPLERTVASPWFPIFNLNLGELKVNAEEYAAALRAEGIPCAASYTQIPIYQYEFMRRYAKRNMSSARYEHCCPVAENSLNRILRLWGGELHEFCTHEEVRDIADAFEKLENSLGK